MRNVNAARSPPADVSMIQGMKCSSVAGSKYSRFSPDACACRPRSQSPRLWIPSSSFQPKGKRYSTSMAFLA